MIGRLPALALVAFAALYLWQTLAIPLDPWSATEAINARTLPFAYGVVLFLVGAALLIRPHALPSSGGDQTGSEADAGTSRRWLKLAAQCVIIVGFGVAIPFVGPWVALGALLVASLLAAGERRLPILIFLPIGTAAAAWLIVAVLLDVYVDPGSLFARLER